VSSHSIAYFISAVLLGCSRLPISEHSNTVVWAETIEHLGVHLGCNLLSATGPVNNSDLV
jgi:hypothetical protein